MKSSVVVLTLLALISRLKCEKLLSGRIVGGSTVQIGQIPSQLSLRTINNVHFCGGALVAGRWAISSAHCTTGRAHNSINIVAGTVTLGVGGIAHRSQLIVQHPDFHALTSINDVALVQSAVEFTMTEFVRTIPLGIGHLGGGFSVQLSGFGATQAGGAMSNHLQMLHTTTITNDACRTRLTNQNLQVSDTKLCTFTGSGQGICAGDQGGPVIDRNGQLVAVKSWSVPCAIGFPDGHERISSHRQWILSII